MGRENNVYQNRINEEYEDNREEKIMAKMYDPDSTNKINGDFGMAKYDDNSDNDNEEHIA